MAHEYTQLYLNLWPGLLARMRWLASSVHQLMTSPLRGIKVVSKREERVDRQSVFSDGGVLSRNIHPS